MDWGNVTAEDLVGALREVDWSSPPRPLSEFSSRFESADLPPSGTAALNAISIRLGFLRRPLAIRAALFTALSISFLNDSVKELPCG